MSLWHWPQFFSWLTADIGAFGSLLRGVVCTLPWHPWQVAGSPPFTRACTLSLNGVISSSWHSRHGSNVTLPRLLRGCLVVSASVWHSTQSTRLCAPAPYCAAITAIDAPASDSYSASSWHLKHFSFGIFSAVSARRGCPLRREWRCRGGLVGRDRGRHPGQERRRQDGEQQLCERAAGRGHDRTPGSLPHATLEEPPRRPRTTARIGPHPAMAGLHVITEVGCGTGRQIRGLGQRTAAGGQREGSSGLARTATVAGTA